MKKKILHLCGFLILIGVLCTSFIITKPKKQVSADTPSLYYFDLDTSHDNYMTIILYLLDIDSILVIDTCSYTLTGYNPATYGTDSRNGSMQFLRYTQLDHDDYDAYIYNFNYLSVPNRIWTSLSVYSAELQGESTTFSNSRFPYYPTYDQYIDIGYDRGYDDGEDDATIARDTYWEQYIDDEYINPQGPGYQLIYQRGRDDGFSAGQQSLDTMSWFQTITSGVSNIFSLQLLPSITIGALIFIPLMFMILSGVLWIWRKK